MNKKDNKTETVFQNENAHKKKWEHPTITIELIEKTEVKLFNTLLNNGLTAFEITMLN